MQVFKHPPFVETDLGDTFIFIHYACHRSNDLIMLCVHVVYVFNVYDVCCHVLKFLSYYNLYSAVLFPIPFDFLYPSISIEVYVI